MKIFRLILILALGLQIGFGEGENGSSGSGQNVSNDIFEEHNYYLKYQSKTIVNDGECGVCDEVKDGYYTERTKFDTTTGTTYCSVYEYSTGKFVGYANKTVKSCAYINSKEAKEAEKEYKEIVETTKKNNGIKSSIGEKTQNSSGSISGNGPINFSHFIAGLLTLNPSIIDRSTNQYGEIVLKQPIKGSSFIELLTGDKKIKDHIDDFDKQVNAGNETNVNEWANVIIKGNIDGKNSIVSTDTFDVLDSFNKINMQYFNDLFASMEKIYQHLQIFIFVLIGGFFVTQIGASKLQAYLENRGESEGKQPYLHKFYIPLLMIGIFFMPIPEGNGHQSTVMQNMIRYFAQYSTTIADMAHSVGAKTYIEKIYKTAGRLSPEMVNNLTKVKGDEMRRINQIDEDLKSGKICKGCSTKISDNTSVFNGSTKNSINCNACLRELSDYSSSLHNWSRIQGQINKVKNYNKNYAEVLGNLDKYFASRAEQLGWIDVLLTPTAGILVEIHTLSKMSQENPNDKSIRIQKAEEYAKKLNIALKVTTDNISRDEARKKADDEINESLIGAMAGELVWMMFPGATAIKDFIQSSLGSISDIIVNMFGHFVGLTVKIPINVEKLKIGGSALSAVTATVSTVKGMIFNTVLQPIWVTLSYWFTTILMKWTFSMIPILVFSVATLVAFISYLVSLCKYFYISPFVTAWAMATKRTDKIIDFLLVGIAIFLRPILIVLFVYLALFMYVLVDEFFIFVATNQFSGIQTDWHDFHTNFIVGAIKGLIIIFGGLAGSYVAWKLIVSGPGWALGLVGLDGKHDDMIAGGLEANLAKRAFVA